MAGETSRLVVSAEIAYGLSSRFLELDGVSIPTRVAAEENFVTPRTVYDAGIRVRCTVSFFERIVRRMLTPHTCCRPSTYRSDLKGIANSAVQPLSNRRPLASQTVFQS